MITTAKIIKYDGKFLLLAPDADLFRELTKKIVGTVEIRLTDGRTISPEQRKKIFALVRDIAIWNGDNPETIRQLLTLDFVIKNGLDVMDIKQGEYLGKDPMTGKPRFSFIEDDDERDRLETIGYMAYFEYLNGFRKVVYWSREKMLSHADKYSPAFSAKSFQDIQDGKIAEKDMWRYSSFWYKNFDDMAKKTLLRHIISRWGVMSLEMQTAFERDSSVSEIGEKGDIVTAEEAVPEEAPTIPTAPDATDIKQQVNLNDLPD